MAKKNPDTLQETKNKYGDLWVYCYEPKTKVNNEAVVFFHGGGYVIGSNYIHGAVASDMAAILKRKVYLIEYPLFPESKLKILLIKA